MHLNTQLINEKRQVDNRATGLSNSLRIKITFGVTVKQWMASFLICLLLIPMFTIPARASFVVMDDQNVNNFEPVNEELWFWEDALSGLNTKVEKWTTPVKKQDLADNASGNGDADKSKKTDKGKKQETTNNEKKGQELTELSKPQKNKKVSSEIAETDLEIKEDKEAISPDAEITKIETSSTKDEKEVSNKKITEDEIIENEENVSILRTTTNQLSDEEYESIYNSENNLGNPFGQMEKDSNYMAAVGRIQHRAGIANFNFGVPLASLAGRGIDAGVDLTYNSRMWNVSYNENQQKQFTYNVDQSWIAPGFTSGFGYLETQAKLRNVIYNAPNNDWHTEITPLGLIEPDGTRRQLHCKTFVPISGANQERCQVYTTTDGSFIEFQAKNYIDNPDNSDSPYTENYSQTSFVTTHPGGTKIWYSGGFGDEGRRKHYPLIIQDRNGNRIRIAYIPDESGRIDYITDTLNRKIKFYYEADQNGDPDRLLAVTIPGMNSNDEIQTVRFYYEEIPLQSAGKFNGQITAPATIDVLKYLYIPGTKDAYEYEYHPNFGMIRKIIKRKGVIFSDLTNLNSNGNITNAGTVAATTEYNYPTGNSPLNEVPKYNKRTDDWNGRTASQPQETFYDVPQPSGGESISRITIKDKDFDIETESRLDQHTGLLKENSVKRIYGSANQFIQVMSKTRYFWSSNPNVEVGRNAPRLDKIEVTNEAGLTKATEYEYDQYNNQTKVKEYDYDNGQTTPGVLLRTTEIDYENGQGWLDKNLHGLVKSIKRKLGGAIVSKTEFEYDNAAITPRNDLDISGHSTYYNPAHPAWTETICPDGEEPGQSAISDGCITIDHPGYNANSIYRGNVTKTINYSDATLANDANADVKHLKYDIVGNVVESSLSCCQVRSYNYSKLHEYAFQVSETSGSSPTQLTTSATYNRNTGLLLTTKDENNQITSYQYEPDTLRQKQITYPNGGYVKIDYSDKLASGTLPTFVRTKTSLESNKTVQSYSYYDGRGSSIRNAKETADGWSVMALEYDKFARPVKSYNPFIASVPNGAIPSGTKFEEVKSHDALGRITNTKLQDDTIVLTSFSNDVSTPAGFNNTFVTITDQAGKKRRQVADALGRIIRVDEPDENGELGDVDEPSQPTYYEFDGNDNIKKVIQTDGAVTQERLFKYDSLSRLTHEKHIEATPTLDDNGIKQSSGGLWTKVMKYNADGLITEGVDALGVKTSLTYDGLNRVTTIAVTGEANYQTPTKHFTYDEQRANYYNNGRLTKVTTDAVGGSQNTPATEQVVDYDKEGNIVKHKQTIGGQNYQLEYVYNLAGQLVSEKYPSGRTINFGRDANGRLKTIGDSTRSYLTDISFNNGILPSEMNYGNGTKQTFEYNERLQMTNQTLIKDSETIQKFDYGFGQIDSNGNLDKTKNNGQLAKIESHIGNNKQWIQKFKYDSIGRLKKAEEYRGDTNALSYRQKFDYDNFGNLYRQDEENPTDGQETPISFEPIEDEDIDQNTNRFTASTGTVYNDAGQVVTDNKFRDMNFGYDANGRMVKAVRNNSPDAKTVYDAMGRRVATKINDVWQIMIYDAFGRLIAEYGDTTSEEGGVKYHLSDWQGSPRAILNSAGFVMSRKDYQAFGGDINAGIGLRESSQGFGGGIEARPGFGLTENDSSSGLNHTWFRKMDNQAGRWTSPDPYNGSMNPGNPQTFNRYNYVENEPTNYIDPSGLVRIQQCTKYWWYDKDGNYRQFIGGCITIYDSDNENRAGASPDDKQYINCVKAAMKKYRVTHPGSKKWKKYVKERDELVDEINEKYSDLIFGLKADLFLIIVFGWSWKGVAALAVKRTLDSGKIHREWQRRAKKIAENHPEAFAYHEASKQFEAERLVCEKYLPKEQRTKPWSNNR